MRGGRFGLAFGVQAVQPAIGRAAYNVRPAMSGPLIAPAAPTMTFTRSSGGVSGGVASMYTSALRGIFL